MEETKTFQHNDISISKQLRLYFSISLGMFLFILFYDPFALIRFENDDRLLFIAGLGGIIFFFLCLFLIILHWIISKAVQESERISFPDSYFYLLIWITSSVAFVFYLRYVGQEKISMYLVFKIALLCLFPPVIAGLDKSYYIMKQQIKLLNEKNKMLTTLLQNSESRLKQNETFISENKTEKITLQLDDIVVIRSADNYIEIVFREGKEIKQKLIRNTLRNIEAQLTNYPYFIRCHRTCIVNMKLINNLFYSYKGYRLSLTDYNEEIPVSRQYLLKVKEVIAAL